ncbi:TetR/AcrR family transcriptional regulator [Komagataeibacter sucrofermentans]|uniref:TetR family transcriptional regulator n=1 Tax=Komagataeibacter sucrofermentans TaxID=1053551 RepID=A0A318QLN2_9PROT|nr:TetR-like C-terminal domain-containing protein [Komagataeibacter sucrofermentans]PYD78894.1 TetR family transcriptional regulator [Komagataeibacter sucrofermentans]GBQ46513.1 TetR family transcriptional regulator [Komagataeibacter sucrofermentans DSM 15973]
MKTKEKGRYHHGDLQATLLRSARVLLERDGIAALKLRAITRHAGVSATAAAPYFGNLAGLLSVLAAQGFDELTEAMSPPHALLARDVGLAYIRFAIANPGLFTLMFRSDAINRTDAHLVTASERAFRRLAALPGPGESGTTQAATMAARWGKAHGLAVLAIDGLLLPLTNNGDTCMTLDQLVNEAFR